MSVQRGWPIYDGPDREQLEAAVKTFERIFGATIGSPVRCGTVLMLLEDSRIAAVPWAGGEPPDPEEGEGITYTLCGAVLARGLE